jgi:hypothetical protein
MVGEAGGRANSTARGGCAPAEKSTRSQGLTTGTRYNPSNDSSESDAMEAERINQIASKLEGLRERTAQLRRYL